MMDLLSRNGSTKNASYRRNGITSARGVVMIRLSRRELRGLGILEIGGMIKRLGEGRFAVKSEETDSWYIVKWEGGNWTCSCVDYSKRKKPCKHIYAVNFLLNPMIMLSTLMHWKITCLIVCIIPNRWKTYYIRPQIPYDLPALFRIKLYLRI